MILLATVESVIVRALRALLHRHEEIELAPPLVRDPGHQISGPMTGDEQVVGGPFRRVAGRDRR